ncbi:MAG: YdcF family protein [Bacteroidia bacterium]|nr:YdcF family protein [Bacteroidia bacterium]
MFFVISKILSFIVSPIVWVALLLLYALFGKKEHLKKKCLLSGVVLFFVFSNPFIFNETMRLWEEPTIALNQLPVYDTGIILGSTTNFDESIDRIQFLRSGDRLFQGIELYKKGKIKKIIYCGGSGSIAKPEEREGESIKRYLSLIGIPDSNIIIENYSRNTHENAVFTKSVLDSLIPQGKYLLITSAYHIPRAKRCFEKEKIPVDAYGTDRMSSADKYEIGTFILPSASVMESWNVLSHELLGFVIYKMAGYI